MNNYYLFHFLYVCIYENIKISVKYAGFTSAWVQSSCKNSIKIIIQFLKNIDWLNYHNGAKNAFWRGMERTTYNDYSCSISELERKQDF
jgi:hypothetical protein